MIDDPTGKFLKVKLICKNKLTCMSKPYMMDEGSSITWKPNPSKLSTSKPGVLFKSYQDDWFGESVSVLEMDGKIDSLEELVCHPLSSTQATRIAHVSAARTDLR